MDKEDQGLNKTITKFTYHKVNYEIDLVPQEPKYTYRVFEVIKPVGEELKETFITQFRTMKKCTATEIRNKAKAKV